MNLPVPAPGTAALVTGASSGIGEALAQELAGRGHNLILVARSRDKLERLASTQRMRGVRVDVLPTDLSQREARTSLPERVAELGLTVDVLVNNAGLSTSGPVIRSTPGAELNVVEVDVAAVVDLCTRFLPVMVERGCGAILNVASTAAFNPMPGQTVYAASKAFVKSYTEGLAAELRGSGVSLTALCPGPVNTAFIQTAGFAEGVAEKSLPGFMWRTPEEVARAGINGLAKGQLIVIPGLPNRVGSIMSSWTPNRILVPLLAKAHPSLRRHD